MQMVSSKISPPDASGIILRHHLLRWLKSATPVHWIVGPPGAGKTSLAASYLAKGRTTPLWYQIDERDSDVATFFHYLSLAVHNIAPQESKALLSLGNPNRENDLSFARRFFDQLYSLLKQPFTLLFDNYQELPHDCALHSIIRAALEQLPKHGHAVILSREFPPSSMARLCASNCMEILEPEALRIQKKEAQRIARAHKSVSETEIETLLQHSQGWAAGLVLLLRQKTLKSREWERTSGNTPTPEILFDYFAAEVFAQFDPTSQKILQATAALPKMTASMARSLAGHAKAQTVLEDLSRAGYFVTRHPGNETTYQYHPLFREFLLKQNQRELSQDAWLDLQRQAALILSKAGEVEDAVDLLREIGDWQQLAKLMLQNAPMLLVQARSQTLEGWIRSLPESQREVHPWLFYWLGCCQIPKKDGTARPNLRRAVELFREQGDATGVFKAWSAMVSSYLSEMGPIQPLDRWIAYLQQLVKEFPKFASQELEAEVTCSYLAALQMRQPGNPDVATWVARAYHLLEQDLDPLTQLWLLRVLHQHESYYGSFRATRQLAERFRKPSPENLQIPLIEIFKSYSAAETLWAEHKPEIALEHVQRGLRIAEQAGVPKTHLLTHATASALTLGDLKQAKEFLDRLQKTIENHHLLHIAIHALLAGELALRCGDLAKAFQYAESALSFSEEAGFPRYAAVARMGLGLASWKLGDTESALEHLAESEHFARETKSQWQEFPCLLYRAAIEFEKGEEAKGFSSLRSALAIGRAQGYVNWCAWRFPEVLAMLCNKALAEGIEVDYVQELIRIHKFPPDETQPPASNWPWPLRIRSLGTFAIETYEENLKFSRGQRSLELLQRLIASPRCQLEEAEIKADLRYESDGSLRTALHRLRKQLGETKVLISKAGTLQLDLSHCWLDSRTFCERIEELEKTELQPKETSEIAALLEELLDLYRGPFLPNLDTSWAKHYRSDLRNQFTRAVIKLVSSFEVRKDWQTAASYYQRALESDDALEELQQHYWLASQKSKAY